MCQPLIPNCDVGPEDYSVRTLWNNNKMMYEFWNKCPQCEDGFYWNETLDKDGNWVFGCTNLCSEEIDEHCSSCSLHGEECLTCTDGYMVAFNKTACVPYLAHCTVEIKDQPDLVPTKKLAVWNNQWKCGTCENGYYWDSFGYMCESCSICNCDSCVMETDKVKCTKCINGKIPSFDGITCEDPLQYCNVPVKLQISNGSLVKDPKHVLGNQNGKWACLTSTGKDNCIDGYYWSSTLSICNDCEENCKMCSDGNSCDECKVGFEYNSDAKKCMAFKSRNCLTVNKDGTCEECIIGYGFDASGYCQIDCKIGSLSDSNCLECAAVNGRIECINCPLGSYIDEFGKC